MRSEPVFDIQQATKNDISIIEDIFFDVIRWMDEKPFQINGIQRISNGKI